MNDPAAEPRTGEPPGAPPREPRTLWRVFPWDPAAAAGAPFAPEYLRPGQTSGRFDLQDRPPLLYAAETAAHAVGEKLQAYRGRSIRPAHLIEHGHQLALVALTLPAAVVGTLADLTDPATLAQFDCRPDEVASMQRGVTQAIARRIHDADRSGLRWWSAITGDWHSVVLFADRLPAGVPAWGTPEPLSVDHPAVLEAVLALGVRVERRPRGGRRAPGPPARRAT